MYSYTYDAELALLNCIKPRAANPFPEGSYKFASNCLIVTFDGLKFCVLVVIGVTILN